MRQSHTFFALAFLESQFGQVLWYSRIKQKQPTIVCLTLLLLCVCRANRSTNQSTRRSPSLALSSGRLPPFPDFPIPTAPASRLLVVVPLARIAASAVTSLRHS